MKTRSYTFPIWTLLLSALFLITSCSRNPVTGKREVMLMSEGQEISLGNESDPQIVAAYGLYQDDQIQAFINKKGQEMAKISHRPNLKYDFKVLDSPVVNAFAVPGGYVYFTRGILAHFNNEAEFAGVLGHEIGHITARHSAKQYSKQMLAQVLFVGGLIVSEDFRNWADVASQGMGLLFLKFGRDHESQSDELGVEYSTKIGYDAHEMADFFNVLARMRDQSGQSIPTFMSTHPDPGDRYNKVNKMADEKQKSIPAGQLKVNRDSYLSMIDGIIYGEDPRQGYVENNVFYHPELKFQYPVPSLWKTVNSPSQVQMTPEDGKALMVFTLAQGTNLQDAAQKVVNENKLAVIESNNTTVNGFSAVAILGDQTQQNQQGQSQTLRILTYLIQYGSNIYVFHGLSVKQDFNRYYNTFTSTMKGFKKLTDQAKINKKPTRIHIKTTSRSATLRNQLQTFGAKSVDLNTLSLLNDIKLDATVPSGTKIKVFGE